MVQCSISSLNPVQRLVQSTAFIRGPSCEFRRVFPFLAVAYRFEVPQSRHLKRHLQHIRDQARPHALLKEKDRCVRPCIVWMQLLCF